MGRTAACQSAERIAMSEDHAGEYRRRVARAGRRGLRGNGDADQVAPLGGARILLAGFDDLYNLVSRIGVSGYRVAAGEDQRRARTPGMRSGHGDLHRVRVGVDVFLDDVRAQLKARSFSPGSGAAGHDSQGVWGKCGRWDSYCGPTGWSRLAETLFSNRSSRPTFCRARTVQTPPARAGRDRGDPAHDHTRL